jgi:hypothetical protein
MIPDRRYQLGISGSSCRSDPPTSWAHTFRLPFGRQVREFIKRGIVRHQSADVNMMGSFRVRMIVIATQELPVAIAARCETHWAFPPKYMPTAKYA